jgi:3-oxoacyl-[acyl-carrier protein] reductase
VVTDIDPAASRGRGVVISGGTSGIGLAAAAEFLAHGDTVAIGGRERAKAEEAAADLRARFPVANVVALELDGRSARSVESGFAEALERLGEIQVLVNSAGIFPRFALADLDEATWQYTIETNLSGTYRCCRVAAPLIERAGGGAIVNVGSIWAQHVWPNRSAYAASKAGVEQFTRAIALELAPRGVRVNAVSPGIMRTAMTEGVLTSDVFVNTFMPRVTVGRVGDPATELAGLIRFLTLDEAAYMAGEVVTVYGGYY